MNWIDWETHTPPEDIKGILVKYEDGTVLARRDKDHHGKPIGWRFMERARPKGETVHPVIRKCKTCDREMFDYKCSFCYNK